MKQDWKMVKLGEVLKLSKHNIKLLPERTYKQVTIKMNRKGVTLRGLIQGSQVISNQYIAKANQFIISKIDARNGAYGIVPNELDGAIVTGDFVLFDHSERVDGNFLNYFSNTHFFDFECKKASEGTTNRVRLKIEKFLQIEIPLPPLPEQQRIAGRLAALKGKMDAVRALREEQVREVEKMEDNYVGEQFKKAFSEYPSTKISEVALLITKGSSPNWQGIDYVENNGVLFITSENVRKYKIRLEPKKFVEARFNEIEKKSILRRDDILMNIVGASIGRTAIYDRDDAANINQAVCLIRLNQTKIDLEYALHFFNSPVCVGYMSDKQVDAARANLSMGNIANFQIPLPTISEQHRIVSEIKAFQTKMEALKASQAEQLSALEGLFPAVLERAFRGEW